MEAMLSELIALVVRPGRGRWGMLERAVQRGELSAFTSAGFPSRDGKDEASYPVELGLLWASVPRGGTFAE